MMNILILNYEYPPLGGGAGNALRYILNEFSTVYSELNIDIVTSSEEKKQTIKLSNQVTIHKLDIGKRGNIHFQTSANLITYIFKTNTYIKKLIKQKKYNLIHCFFSVPTGIIGYWNRRNIPYIISLRGSDVPYYNERFSFLYKIITPVIRTICKHASTVVANSQQLHDLAKQSMKEIDIKVISNGVDINKFKPYTKKNKSVLKILFVGRLIERKGVKYLLEAFAQIKTDIKVILDIVGTGDKEKELKKLAQLLKITESVNFSGAIREEQLIEKYKEANVFILPSLNEGMSNALLEAIASGLPVIVTDTGGTKELVNNNGIIVQKKSTFELSKAMVKLISEPETRIKMGKKSRNIAKNYSWAKVAENYYALYLKTTTSNR